MKSDAGGAGDKGTNQAKGSSAAKGSVTARESNAQKAANASVSDTNNTLKYRSVKSETANLRAAAVVSVERGREMWCAEKDGSITIRDTGSGAVTLPYCTLNGCAIFE